MAAGGLMLMGVVPGVGEILHGSSDHRDARRSSGNGRIDQSEEDSRY